ncbi:MAG: hypothetical protein JRF43_06910 [Deltaproteobacteria bacterium]|nr:hypothetical protein [Deltaproteobacteria bacterium]
MKSGPSRYPVRFRHTGEILLESCILPIEMAGGISKCFDNTECIIGVLHGGREARGGYITSCFLPPCLDKGQDSFCDIFSHLVWLLNCLRIPAAKNKKFVSRSSG